MKGPCPQCSEPLREVVTRDNIEVDRCDGCQGTYFDAGELQQAAQVAEAALTPSIDRPGGAHTCPGCSQPMGVAEVWGHWVDVCPDCRGVFVSLTVMAALKQNKAAAGVDEPIPEVANHVKGRPGSTTEAVAWYWQLLDMVLDVV